MHHFWKILVELDPQFCSSEYTWPPKLYHMNKNLGPRTLAFPDEHLDTLKKSISPSLRRALEENSWLKIVDKVREATKSASGYSYNGQSFSVVQHLYSHNRIVCVAFLFIFLLSTLIITQMLHGRLFHISSPVIHLADRVAEIYIVVGYIFLVFLCRA